MPGSSSTDIWVAGAFAAFTVDLVVYPLDTVKTRIQSPDYNRLYLNEATNTIKKGALFRGLYQGVTSVIVATLPASGAFFTTYEHSKSLFRQLNPSFNGSPLLPLPIVHGAASGLAELVSCAILTPAEVIKQNSQMVKTTSSVSATRQTIRKFSKNPFALWRGYGALAGRNLPMTALQFPIYERFRIYVKTWRDQKVGRKRDDKDISTLENGLITAVSAGSAGSIAAVITTPVDVVKTRIMLAALEGFATQDQGSKVMDAFKEGKIVDAVGEIAKENKKSPGKKMSSWAIGKEIVETQGWKGLMRGGVLRGVWTMLGSGLYLGVYESGKSYLASRRSAEQQQT